AAVVLTAFKEVEIALASSGYLEGQEVALTAAVEESREAERLALEEYVRGIVDVITLLESQRRSAEAKRALAKLRNRKLQNRLDLYLALGGEFDNEEERGEVPNNKEERN
ncbi:MAG: hypothetical protein V3T30_05790, partial [Thermodesulfobacteriota bacterium]